MEMKTDRIAIIVVFVMIGALAYGWWHNNQRIVTANQERIDKFINVGKRFTAEDGQQLCERIQVLETHPGPCTYVTKR